jgi:hypothetical protein
LRVALKSLKRLPNIGISAAGHLSTKVRLRVKPD